MVTVTVSETYDLSTKRGKMSIVGIHTPSKNLIAKTYPGLAINSKMFKFVKCDVKMACAQMLPADPLQVGVSAGKIAPQDMFNPILYKAMSNEAMNNFELRVHGLVQGSGDISPVFNGESVISQNDGLGTGINDEQIYYNLLANHKGWKVAHPQHGLVMSSLRPYVYERLYDVGQNTGDTTINDEETFNDLAQEADGDVYVRAQGVRGFRGRPHPMPAINCTHLTSDTSTVNINFAGNQEKLQQADMPDIKPVYVACLCLPPSKLNILYYRLVVRWTIAFLGIRPIQEILNWGTMQYDHSTFYGIDYTFASSKMDTKLDMVDAQDAEIEKVMEGI